MGAKFSSGGGATVFYDKTDTPGETVTELVNASDGAGLHFDGSAGNIDIASPPDLGTKFSFEFVIKTDAFGTFQQNFVDFGTGGRFVIASNSSMSWNLGIYDQTSWKSFGVKVLDDLKVHHLVVTVDGTSAVLYDNGNQVATVTISSGHAIDSCTDAKIGSAFNGSGDFVEGTYYRTRFYNKALSSTEVQTAFERADVDFSSQYGSETDLVNANSSGSGTAWTGATGVTPPTGWSAAGSSRTYTIDSGTGNPAPSLKIEAGSPNIGIKWGGTAVLGRRYQATFSYKCGDAATTLAYRLNDADSFVNLDNSTTWATKTVEWTGDGVTGGFMLRVNESGKFGHFDTVSIKAIGCVSDYDLAFANPTQSLTVQDRSGAADGTCSASGVTQVQPIIQGNLTSLRVGAGQAATPADNQVLVDGGTVSAPGYSFAHTTNTGMWSNGGGKILFTNSGSTSVTINSSGNIIIANMPTSASGLASGTLYSDSGTIKIV